MNETKATSPSSPPLKRGWLAWLTWLATEDHCAWANQYVYWVKTPLGVLLTCAVFSLLCGLFVAYQAYLLLAVIAAVVVVGVAWPSVAVRGLRCRLVFTAQRGREGKPTQAKLIVTNRWPWPVWGLAVDDPAFARASGLRGEAGEAPVALARIDGWSRNSYNWTFVPPLRGVYPSQEVRVVTGFPFGLRRASRSVEVDSSLTVWPETFWLPQLDAHLSRRDWGGELSESLIGTDGTRLGVRDYRQGDNLRDIHWAKSARHERLIVSEREASVVEEYQVFVDVALARHAGTGGDSTLEWSLKIAASICESVVGGRGRVELWLGDEKFSAGAGASGGSLDGLLDGIARFDSSAPSAGMEARWRARSDLKHAVSIGTDASDSLCGRAIVLQREAFLERSSHRETEHDRWISVESADDVPGQVLRGWRCPKKRVLRAK